MRRADSNGNDGRNTPPAVTAEADLIALQALAWVLGDQLRAERLLALTGLDADQLRARAGSPEILAATIDFLCNHEPDLLACAEALGLSPEELARIGERLTA